MENKAQRSSNIELLRCVAMLMIVLHHIVCHCVNIQLTDRSSMQRMDNGLFIHPMFYKKLILLDTINTFGLIGNVIFILISGYFIIYKGNNIDVVKISKKLLLQLGFSAIFLTVASTICFWTMSDVFLDLIDIQFFNSMAWFVGYYYAVILIAALFLNDFLLKADRKKYMAFLAVCFAFIQFGWTGDLAEGLIPGLRTLLTGVFLYALGGAMRKYNLFSQIRTYVLFAVIAAAYFLVILSAYNTTEYEIENYIRSNSGDIFFQTIPVYSNYSIVVIVIGICVFEIFLRIRIPQSRFLNYLGQTTFMCYLIHDNGLFYSIWNTQDWITLLYHSPYRFLLNVCLWTLAVFLCGVAVYTLYTILAALFSKYKWILFKEQNLNICQNKSDCTVQRLNEKETTTLK